MTIALTPEIESALAAQSQRRGLTSDELAQQLLRDGLQQLQSNGMNGSHVEQAVLPAAAANGDESQESLIDWLGDYVGVVEGTGEAHSRHTGQRFTQYVMQKKQEGRL